MDVDQVSGSWSGNLGGVADADGSAISRGTSNCGGDANWEMIAAVYGPAAARSKDDSSECATISVTYDSLAGPPTVLHNTIAIRIEKWLRQVILRTMHPRSHIVISIQSTKVPNLVKESVCEGKKPPLQDGKGDWLWEEQMVIAFNTAALALLDAGIPMRGVPVAVLSVEGMLTVHVHGGNGNSPQLLHHSWMGFKPLNPGNLQGMLNANQLFSQQHFSLITSIIENFYRQPE